MKSTACRICLLSIFLILLGFPLPLRAADEDGDGVDSSIDNCPSIANPDQADLDGDRLGDLCDEDRDGDGLTNQFEQEVLETNPNEWDTDGDRISDFYDCEPLDPDNSLGSDCDRVIHVNPPTPITPEESFDPSGDDDQDGILNGNDNCPFVFNPGQQDVDRDGKGDQCDNGTAASGSVPPDNTLINGVLAGEGGCSLVGSARSGDLFSLPFFLLLLIGLRKAVKI